MRAGYSKLRPHIATFIVLVSLAACAGGLAEEDFSAALTLQWANVRNTQVSPGEERPSYRLLRLVMDGAFLEEAEDELGSRILAAAFPLLVGIPEEDVPAFAKEYHLPETLAEQAWWFSLANTLRASLQIESPETQTRAQSILDRWLESPESGETAADEDMLLEIAGKFGLTLRFVRFLSGGSTPGSQSPSQPTETHRTGQAETTPAPSPGNGTDNGSGNGQQGPGGPKDDAGSPQKRR